MYRETTLINEAKAYAHEVLDNLPEQYSYHNTNHTIEVVDAAIEIGEASHLSEEELELIVVAAWMHDIGYTCGFKNHEEESARMMEVKLKELQVSPEKIEAISNIIKATQMPQSPQDGLSKVMCDADLYHLSTEKFKERSESLRQELNCVCDQNIKKKEWRRQNYGFLSSHHYFTDYGKQVLEPRKQENIARLEGGKKKKKSGGKAQKLEQKLEKLKDKLEQTKKLKPDRGIETMFRITSKNHLTLSAMADNKANIMISINSIILSVLISLLFRKFEDYPNLIIPGMILTVVCLATIVFAVLATRPNVSTGTFTKEDIINRKTNLLFFGNFYNMKLDDYHWGMKEMMKDADFLYGSMIKDIYFLGLVLSKKYRMLRKSYNVFMFGFIIAILSFVIAMVFFPAR